MVSEKKKDIQEGYKYFKYSKNIQPKKYFKYTNY